MRRGLGDATVDTLFRVHEGRVPSEADLSCYWFAKAWEALQAKRVKRAGLVATNSIRRGANRRVLEAIAEAGAIFERGAMRVGRLKAQPCTSPWSASGRTARRQA